MMKVGASISVFALIAYMALRKSFSMLNKLMLQLQFFAYISIWQLSPTKFVETCLKEIRRIVLGEYFDDFSLSQKIMNALFDMPSSDDDDSVEEKIGEERLGSKSIMKNFGITLLIISTILVVVILVCALATFIMKRTGYTGKFKQRVQTMWRNIFFNMLISLCLLNGLKYYILAFTALARSDSGVESKLIGAFVLTVFVLLPLYFARMLKKN